MWLHQLWLAENSSRSAQFEYLAGTLPSGIVREGGWEGGGRGQGNFIDDTLIMEYYD